MTDRIFLGHTTARVATSVTRPADTTAYAAGDGIGTAATQQLTMDDVARSDGGAGMICGLHVIDSANVATKPSLEVWLFSAAIAAAADNAAFAPTDDELANLIGVVELDESNVGTSGADAAGNCILRPSIPPMLPFKCATASADIYAYLVVRNAYVPVSAETFTLVLHILQDY